MFDSEWYFQPTSSINVHTSSNIIEPTSVDLSPYQTIAGHVSDVSIIHNRIETESVYVNSRIDALNNSTSSNSNAINIVVNERKKEKDFWDVVDPIIDVGGDILGELAGELFRKWLEGSGWKQALADAVGDLLGNQDLDGDGVQDEVPALQPDFLKLKNCVFAADRIAGTSGIYGVGIARDLSVTTNARLCRVPAQEIIYLSDKYGEEWATSMTSVKKVPVIDFGTLTATLCNVITSNLTSKGISTTEFSTATSTLGNATANILTIAGQPALRQNDAITISSLNIGAGGLFGGIDQTGNITCSSIDINGGAVRVFGNGSVSLGGIFVADGPNRKLIVYDDDILPRSQRFRIQDVLSGNIGSTDENLFDDIALPLPPGVRDNPLSFSDLASGARASILQALGRNMTGQFDWMV